MEETLVKTGEAVEEGIGQGEDGLGGEDEVGHG